MPQPLFYLGPEYILEDYIMDTDLHTEGSYMSEAETESQTESVTEALRSSVTDLMSTCGYWFQPFKVPPPSPMPSVATSSNGSALRPSLNNSSKSVLSFLRFYDNHDRNDEDHLPGLLADRETVIIGIMFHRAIEGPHGPLNLKDLATVLKFRNKRYHHWQSLTESMVLGGFVEMLGAYEEPNSTFKSWYFLHDKSPTGNSNAYFRELKAQLLKDLDTAERERDEVENDCIFVEEEPHPAGFDEDKEQTWVSCGRPLFSIEDHEQNLRSVERWIEDTISLGNIPKSSGSLQSSTDTRIPF